MSILETFDTAIVSSEKLGSGYRVNSRTFPNYLSNEEWDIWLSEMSDSHRQQFERGSGGELEPKNGRPPKMASFASSSRMIYKLSKDIADFQFEKQLPTRVGGIANLDGYLDQENNRIYIEAKCREPYSHTAIQTIKQNYKPLYLYLREKMPKVFSCVMEDIPDSRDMRVAFFCKGKSVQYFDIKQMICHMLGVANDMLSTTTNKPILFLYLLFNPSLLEIPEQNREEILRIYKETNDAAAAFEFNEMFGHIVDYLICEYGTAKDKQEIEAIKKSFQFVITDQASYKKYIEK